MIETDKSTIELESPNDGKIIEWKVAAGDIVPVDSAVLVLERGSADSKFRAHDSPRTIPRHAGLSRKRDGADEPAIDVAGDATSYRDRRVAGAHRTLIYRLRRSASIAIQGSMAIEIPWEALVNAEPDASGNRATPFQVFGYAVAQLTKHAPKFRSVMVGDDIVREYGNLNLGLAIARPDDELITAVVRAADTLTLAEFTKSCTQQMRAAIRSGDQAAEDTQILLTHLGEFGIPDAIPTLVAPASSIFFLGVPTGDTKTARVVLTFDHRLINGTAAAHFLEALRARLIDPRSR